MAADQIAQARIAGEVKAAAAEVLAEMGLGISDAIRILLTRIAQDRTLPFDMRSEMPGPPGRNPLSRSLETALDPNGLNQEFGAIKDLVLALEVLQVASGEFRSSYWLPDHADQLALTPAVQEQLRALVLRALTSVVAFDPEAFARARLLGYALGRDNLRPEQNHWSILPALAGFDLGDFVWSAGAGTSAINPTMSISIYIHSSDAKPADNQFQVAFGVGKDQSLAAFCGAIKQHAAWFDAICAAGNLKPELSNVLHRVSSKVERTPSLCADAFYKQFVEPSIQGTLDDFCEGFHLTYSTTQAREVWPSMLAATAITLFAAGAVEHDPEAIYRALGYGNSILRSIESYQAVAIKKKPKTKAQS